MVCATTSFSVLLCGAEIWRIAFLAVSLVGVSNPERFSVSHHSCLSTWTEVKKKTCRDFPAGTMDENLPASAAMDSISGLEDSTCLEATEPMHHNYWARTLEPGSSNSWARVLQRLKPTSSRAHESQLLKPVSPRASKLPTTESHTPRASALQQEKPAQWEIRALQQE